MVALPEGALLAHIDLDYFINSFDGGNRPTPDADEDKRALEAAEHKLVSFFNAVRSLPRPVERWIVATSPGFCAAHHWQWLLHRLQNELARAESGSAGRP